MDPFEHRPIVLGNCNRPAVGFLPRRRCFVSLYLGILTLKDAVPYEPETRGEGVRCAHVQGKKSPEINRDCVFANARCFTALHRGVGADYLACSIYTCR